MPETPVSPTPTPSETTTGTVVIPPAQTPVWIIALACSLGASLMMVLLMGGVFLVYEHERNKPVPQPADPAFVTLGKAYGPSIPKLYAGAWRDGKTTLATTKSMSKAVAAVGASWNSARSTAFEKTVTPELAKIAPESSPETPLSDSQLKAATEAFEGLAQGLEQ